MFLVDVDSIIQSVNIVFIIILLGTALIGFLRGTIKAGFNIVSTILFLVFGFIFMTPISKSLAEMNIESFGIVFDDILVKTPMQLVETIISRDYPQFAFLFEEGTYSFDIFEEKWDFIDDFAEKYYRKISGKVFSFEDLPYGRVILYAERKSQNEGHGESYTFNPYRDVHVDNALSQLIIPCKGSEERINVQSVKLGKDRYTHLL